MIFTKMQSLGNDFVVLDATKEPFNLQPEFIQKIGNRHFGIGFDQLMVLECSAIPSVDFGYRIFNADGSEVEQCGNGVRCLARFIQRHHLPHQTVLKLATKNRMITAFLEGENVRVEMGKPELFPEKIPLGEVVYEISIVSMGNPHAVIEVPSVKGIDVDEIGRLISTHPRFPNQTNVGFMEILDPSTIRLRVYERGVGETLACGSGACAAMVAGRLGNHLEDTVTVKLPGGDLQVRWLALDKPVELMGSGEFVFSGYFDLPIS